MSDTVTIFTIGFTGSSAEHFFERLRGADVRKVIYTRLWASSQLAGFAKKKDLPYFVKELVGADYEYRGDLAPTADILKAYKPFAVWHRKSPTQRVIPRKTHLRHFGRLVTHKVRYWK